MPFSIRSRLTAIAGSVTFAFVVVLATSLAVSARVQGELTRIQERQIPKLELGLQVEREFVALGRAYQDAVAARDLDALERTRERESRILRRIDAARPFVDADAAEACRAAIAAYHEAAYDASRRLIAGETGEGVVDAVEAMQRTQARAEEVIERVAIFDQRDLAEGFRAARDAIAAGSRTRSAILAIVLVVVLALSGWLGRSVVRSVGRLEAGLARFAKGRFDEPVEVSGGDELAGVAVHANQMADSLARLAEERERRDWIKTCLVTLARELGGELAEAEVAARAARTLTRYAGAAAAALYVVAPEDAGGPTLRLVARHALEDGDRPGDARPAFAFGEGLVGEAARSPEIVVVDDPPPGFVRLRSGLGDGPPRSLVLVPLVRAGRVTGVLELAFLAPLTVATRELLDEARESVAIALAVAQSRAATALLLSRTQEQAARLEQLSARLEQKASELARVSVYKSQFLTQMSHELRTPLNSMLLLSKLLEENAGGNLDPQQVEYARTIHSAGRDLLGLINHVLDLAKVEAGKQEIRVESVRLAEVAARVRSVFSPVAQHKGIRLDVDLEDRAPESIPTDGQRLLQILNNLVGNAIKFTDAGEVKLRIARTAHGALAFSVSDTGPGIAPADQERIFAPFEQLESGSRRGGTGLGLGIARELAHLLGGELDLASEPGRGSTFTLRLPIADRLPVRAERERAAAARRPPASELDLLVIEDDPTFAGELGRLIRERGLVHETARDGESGLRIARERRPRGIILDVRLPDTDGWQVLDELRADPRTAAIPVQFVSAAAEPPERARDAGAPGYLTKPVDRKDLVRVVESLGRPRGVDARLDGKKVLVVDDDMRTIYALSAALRSSGAEVLMAENGAVALGMLAEHGGIAAVLMDVTMPEMDGYEAMRRIREEERFAALPIIALTARVMKGEAERCIAAGASDYLPKPVDARALSSILAGRLAGDEGSG